MSDTIPRFKIGDYVRIMQVPRMEKMGLAGKHGFIRDMIDDSALVDVIGGKRVPVSLDSLAMGRDAKSLGISGCH